MKMSRKIILLVTVIGAFSASCKKESEEIPEPTPPTVIPYYIEFDGNKTGVDTCYVMRRKGDSNLNIFEYK